MQRKFLVFPDGKEKALTLSYDDGVDTDIHMIELMEKYGIKCTFNLNAGLFNSEDAVRLDNQIFFRLSKNKAKALYNNPLCEVATHTYTHSRLCGISDSVLMKEIIDDRCELERMFGSIICGHAYPHGEYNDTVVDIWKRAGIVYGRTTESHHTFQLPTDWLRMGATCHHDDPMFHALSDKFIDGQVGQNENGWLFYLWGHTFEFRANDNWNAIEDFFKKVSNNSDIWYATNIEIYEYVMAWGNLVYSANEECVYNPSSIDVWVKVEGRVLCVPAGKKKLL